MATLDYQPKPSGRKNWFTARNLVLAVVCGSVLTAGRWAYLNHGKWALKPPVETSEIDSPNFSGYIIIGAAPDGSSRLRVWSSGTELNDYVVDRFINSEGFGKGRDYDSWTLNSAIEANGKYYLVGSVQLISLNDGAEPFEYINIGNKSMSPFKTKLKTKEFEHVALDQWQADGLKQLQDGKEFVQTGSGKNLRLVGAVRAATSCLQCHEVKPGTLLGAFNYSLYGPIGKP